MRKKTNTTKFRGKILKKAFSSKSKSVLLLLLIVGKTLKIRIKIKYLSNTYFKVFIKIIIKKAIIYQSIFI